MTKPRMELHHIKGDGNDVTITHPDGKVIYLRAGTYMVGASIWAGSAGVGYVDANGEIAAINWKQAQAANLSINDQDLAEIEAESREIIEI